MTFDATYNFTASSLTWPGEQGMRTSESILEILEQNAKWWEKAAAHCESLCQHASDKNRQDLALMSAVYKERADIHARLIEQLRRGDEVRPFTPGGNGNGHSAE
jgi:hypothetical protein